MLRFVKYVGGWPGRVFVIACEPAEVEDVGVRAQRARSRRPSDARRSTSCSRRSPSCDDAPCMSCRSAGARRRHRAPARRGPAGRRSSALRVGRLRQVVPDRCGSTSRSSPRRRSATARGWSQRDRGRACAARRARDEWELELPVVPLPAAASRGRHGRVAGEELEVDIHRGRGEPGGRMHRTKVRIVEDALDANNTIARANRDDFDRHGVDGRQPDERPGRRQDDAARARRSADARRTARRRARGRRAGLARRRPAGQRCTSR